MPSQFDAAADQFNKSWNKWVGYGPLNGANQYYGYYVNDYFVKNRLTGANLIMTMECPQERAGDLADIVRPIGKVPYTQYSHETKEQLRKEQQQQQLTTTS